MGNAVDLGNKMLASRVRNETCQDDVIYKSVNKFVNNTTKIMIG
uniref:Uncharacterized protein n=1 Tax=Meloidogyne enterolobii TaxID=390850 RepID=A0A6V7XCJ9_MELEN|nr:unnamed protein product [Meloidogyne enterolobii]